MEWELWPWHPLEFGIESPGGVQVSSEQGCRVRDPTGGGITRLHWEHALQSWWGHLDPASSSKWLCWCQLFEGAGCLAVSTACFGMEGKLLLLSRMLQQLYWWLPCWPALVTPRPAPVGTGHSFLTPQQGDEVQQSHGLPHCRICIQQGSSLAHSSPCAGQQRRDLVSQDFHQTALTQGIVGILASFWLQ